MKNISINLYKYIKYRSLQKDFQKKLFNKNYEEKLINNKFLKYIANRSEKTIFIKYLKNNISNLKENLPLCFKLKILIKNNKIEDILNLLKYNEINNNINNITNNTITDSLIFNNYNNIIKNLILDIQNLDPSKFYLNNNDNSFINIFKNFIGKEEKITIKDYIILFKKNKIEIERKLKELNIIHEQINTIIINIDNNIKLLKENKDKLIIINKIFENNIENNNFEMKQKQEEILKLLSVINMSIDSLNLNLENLNNINKTIIEINNITNNLFNIGMLLFINKNFSNIEDVILYEEDNFKNYLNNIDKIKHLI